MLRFKNFPVRLAIASCVVLRLVGIQSAWAADEKEMDRIAGVWSFQEVKVSGKEQPQTGHQTDRMIIQKDGRSTVVQQRGITQSTVKVDPAHSPKRYDVTITSGQLKGLSVPAIYELEGDKLTLCLPLGGKERPTELTSKQGDGRLVEVFKRTPETVKDALVAAGRRELTGLWQSVSYALDGKKASDDDMKKVQLVFDAEGNTKALNGGKLFIASSTKLDPTANPATIDITFTGGEGKGTAMGIYKIDGDVLTICRAAPGKARPTEFTSEPGSGLTLMSYKHQTAAAKKMRFRTGVGSR